MVTTRNAALQARRVTRSMAKPTPSGVRKGKATAPQKSLHTGNSTKKTQKRTATIGPTTNAAKAKSNLTSETPSHIHPRAASAAGPVTRSMTTNNEGLARVAPPEPPAKTRKDRASYSQAKKKQITAGKSTSSPSRRVIRQMADQNAGTTESISTKTPNRDVQAGTRPSAATITDLPRARPVRQGAVAHLGVLQRRNWAAENRARLRQALENDQMWHDLDHGQRREVIKLFEWINSGPNRDFQDWFDLPLYDEALTSRSSGDLSIMPRVRAWFEGLKTSSDDEDEEATEDEE